jgi:hypothetical protein
MLMPHWAMALPKARRGDQRGSNKLACTGNGISQRHALTKPRRNGRCQCASGAMCAGRVDAAIFPARDFSRPINQSIN